MKKYIIGIDEVGRGCLAGPVTVVALAIKAKSILNKAKLRDSKKLSPKQRGEWFKYIKSRDDIFYVIKSVSPKIIDKINISEAANLAASRALTEVFKTIKPKFVKGVFLDGGLYVNKKIIANPKTIIKGDEKIPAISLASIVAKVHRDQKMRNLHKNYSEYGFREHKGYGTKKHIKAIKKYGLSRIHRKSFKLK